MKGKTLYSPYDLYHKEWIQDMGMRELGLLTAVRKDVIAVIVPSKESDIQTIADLSNNFYQSSENKYGKQYDYSQYDKSKTNSNSSKKEESKGTAGSNGNTKKQIEDKKDKEVVTSTIIPTPTIIPTSIPVDTSPNILDIDFSELAKTEKNKSVANLHTYFEQVVPSKKNKYTGMFKDFNLIMITAEGFSPYAVHKEITPTLYKLVNSGFVFQEFYTPIWWASTIDGEYVACNSLIPKQGVISFNKISDHALPFALGNQFAKIRYTSKAYHNHSYSYYKRNESHPNMGYDYKGVGNGLIITETWPESDLEMMEVTIPEYVNDRKFHVYYMTVSGHMNYTFIGNSMASKNKEFVKDLPYSEEVKAYIACNIELDRALQKLIDELDKKGILGKTVIALSADHYPYGLEKDKLDEIAGHKVEENYELYKNHFILWSSSIKEPIVIDKPCSSMDILPTLSNLFALPYDSRLMIGTDILSDSSPLVIFSNRSFITDKISYNSVTHEVIQRTKDQVDDGYIETMNQIVKNKFQISNSILELDYYKYIEEYIK